MSETETKPSRTNFPLPSEMDEVERKLAISIIDNYLDPQPFEGKRAAIPKTGKAKKEAVVQLDE